MQGQPRSEGVGVLLPDGTVFVCSGAAAGEAFRPLLLSECQLYMASCIVKA